MLEAFSLAGGGFAAIEEILLSLLFFTKGNMSWKTSFFFLLFFGGCDLNEIKRFFRGVEISRDDLWDGVMFNASL